MSPSTRTLQKKVCMVGACAVGKTSLVRRFVESIFDERYLTTVGVKIDKRVVDIGDHTVNMVLWDLAGEDAFGEARLDYVRGASGVIVVADGTRPDTLETATSLRRRIEAAYGRIPAVLSVNKRDLSDAWAVDEEFLAAQDVDPADLFLTSAASGEAVEELFLRLAAHMVGA